MRLVVIGGVAAGTKAASRARRVDPDLEITIYQEEPEISQSECGLPYLISGVVEERDDLVARTPEEFAEKNVEALTRHRVEKILPDEKKLLVKNLTTDEEFEDTYDRLIIATGARAGLPPIEDPNLDGVFTLRLLADADKILGFIKERSPKKAVIVGAGFIGLEMAENLKETGMEVAIVGEQVERLLGDDEGRIRAVCSENGEVAAELAIIATGAEPEVTLAEEAGAQIGPSGAIWVDKHLKTSLPDVWAAGDCVESVNLVSGEPGWQPLGDTASQMARVAGTNAARGEDVLEYPGILNTGVFQVFELGVAKTGLSEKEAEE